MHSSAPPEEMLNNRLEWEQEKQQRKEDLAPKIDAELKKVGLHSLNLKTLFDRSGSVYQLRNTSDCWKIKCEAPVNFHTSLLFRCP